MVQIKQRWFYSKIDIWLNNGQTKTLMDVFFFVYFLASFEAVVTVWMKPQKANLS